MYFLHNKLLIFTSLPTERGNSRGKNGIPSLSLLNSLKGNYDIPWVSFLIVYRLNRF